MPLESSESIIWLSAAKKTGIPRSMACAVKTTTQQLSRWLETPHFSVVPRIVIAKGYNQSPAT
jgi:hypothetical protein